MAQINLKYPTTLPTATLIADAAQAPGGSVDAISGLTQVGGQSISAALEIQSVLGGLVLPRMTTAQRLALLPINGMEVYDLTLNSFFAYEAGAWMAGGGSVSSISQGANIVLTPNPIVTTGTVALNPVLTAITSIAVGNLTISGSTVANTNLNGNVNLSPNGLGAAIIRNTGNAASLVLFGANNTNFIAFDTGTLTTNTIWTLPITDGLSGQALTTNGAGTLSFSSAGIVSWTNVTTPTQTLAVNNGYVTSDAAGVIYTLPATATLGDLLIIDGRSGITTITQNANQQILIAGASSTVGVGGSATATTVSACITLRCITGGAASVWKAESLMDNWSII